MKHRIIETIRFCGVPLAMMLASCAAAWCYQSREIDAQAYHNLAATYDSANHGGQAAVRQAAMAGPISRWTYAGLMRDILESSRIFVFDTQNVGDVQHERSLLLEKVNAQQ